jgi:CO dehydrogenase maturation factor
VLPHDEDVYEFDCEGKPTIQLPAGSAMRVELEKVLDGLNL